MLDKDGKAVLPPNKKMFAAVFAGGAEAAATLIGSHYGYWAGRDAVPSSADVVIAQLDFLKSYNQADLYDAWLKKALENSDAAPGDVDTLKVYKALALRRDGQKAEGLALLKEVAPKLDITEVDDATAAKLGKPVAPFALAKGGVQYGVIASDAVPSLVAKAHIWLNGLPGDIPAPTGLDKAALQTGALTLTAVLNRPSDAAPWVKAWRAKVGDKLFNDIAEGVFANGLVLLAQGDTKKGSDEMGRILSAVPGVSFAQWAGVATYEALVKAKSKDAGDVQKFMNDVYQTRLLKDYKARLGL